MKLLIKSLSRPLHLFSVALMSLVFCGIAPAQSVPAPSGLSAWWQAENNTSDFVGGNNGVVQGGIAYASGKVGQAFVFSNTSSYITVAASPSLNIGASGTGITIEAWVKPSAFTLVSDGAPIIEWDSATTSGVHFWIAGGGGSLYANVSDTTGTGHTINFFTFFDTNNFQHVALTYDKSSGVGNLYLNGTNVASANWGTFTPETTYPANIGRRTGQPIGLNDNYVGLIDELSLYNRALTSNEIASIYNAGSAGKTVPLTPPLITSQPTNQTVTVGQNATFSVQATGSPTLVYQWQFNTTNIVWATNNSITLTNVQLSQAGNYSVVVSNLANSITSSNALLTVNPPISVPPPSGLLSWWRAESNALDSIGTNNGTLVGGAGYTNGTVGKAFSFDGTSGYVNIPDSASIDALTNQMTVELWLKMNDTNNNPDWRAIACKGNTSWRLFATGGAKTVYFGLTGTSGLDLFGTRNVKDGQWHHVAGVYDGTNMSIYVDGTLDVSKPNTGLISQNNTAMGIGRNLSAPAPYYLNGSVDEVSLYNRALTSNEIASIYNAGSAGKIVPLTPPLITTQPTNQTVTVGQNATFSVQATGSPTLVYQWRLNQTNIVAATNSTLIVTNVQLTQAGNYSVVVSNYVVSVVSSNALLTVNVPVCVPAPSGLVGWWNGAGNAVDSTGNNNGTFVGGASYVAGEVGQAFSFNGSSSYVNIPDSPSLEIFTNRISIELWVKVNYLTVNPDWKGIVTKGNSSWRLQATGSGKSVTFSTTGTSNPDLYGSRTINDGQWHHVAAVYDGTNKFIYVDGTLDVSVSSTGLITPNSYPVAIGVTLESPGAYFLNGSVDEVSLYNRALSSTEIAAIYNAGSAGKCPAPPTPPMITTQPTNQTVTVGQTVTFSVAATGSPTLSYQWRLNQTNIVAATNSTLILTNVQLTQAGNYSVLVSNYVDSVISSNALLTVNFAPAKIQIVNTNGMGGTSITVPVVFVANGDENALSFSVNFDTSRLIYSDIILGSSIPQDASFLPNTSQAGRVGVSLLLPAGHTFAPGTQEIVRVIFNAPILTGTQSVVTVVSFTNQPINKLLSDVNVQPLAVSFINGTVTLNPGQLEGDVIGRPNGDGFVDIFDWQQVGRFVAGLDTISNASEFQRVDSAPRAFLGDGMIKVTDWVQAGRYAAGLDPLTLAGGPTSSPAPGILNGVSGGAHQNGLGSRQISLANASVVKGLPITLPINLESQGNESALAFSLNFNPTILQYVSTSKGSAAASATLNVNASGVASGTLAIALMLPAGSSHFVQGTNEVAKVTFIALETATNYSVSFADQPALRSVSDANANELTATYASSSITINPIPILNISRSGTNVLLQWPVWAGDFTLQSADMSALPISWTNVVITLQTNGANVETIIPAANPKIFFRLQHP